MAEERVLFKNFVLSRPDVTQTAGVSIPAVRNEDGKNVQIEGDVIAVKADVEKKSILFNIHIVTDKDIIDCVSNAMSPLLEENLRQNDGQEVSFIYELKKFFLDSQGFFNLTFEYRELDKIRVAETRFSVGEEPQELVFKKSDYALQKSLNEQRVTESEYEEIEREQRIDPDVRYIVVEDD